MPYRTNIPTDLPADLAICATIDRRDIVTGETIACDVLIYFDVESYTPGCRATWMQPAEGPEFELRFDRAEFDEEPDDCAPGQLTVAELATLEAWFYAGLQDKARQMACDEMRGSGRFSVN